MKKQKDPYELAHTIFGDNFISPEEVMGLSKGIVYTEDQIQKLQKTIPAQEILEWFHNNNFMLVPGPDNPMSLSELLNLRKKYFPESIVKNEGCVIRQADLWYEDYSNYFNEKVETKWYMINTHEIQKIPEIGWAQFGRIDLCSRLIELVWAILIYENVRKFDKGYLRFSSSNTYWDDGFEVSCGTYVEFSRPGIHIRSKGR